MVTMTVLTLRELTAYRSVGDTDFDQCGRCFWLFPPSSQEGDTTAPTTPAGHEPRGQSVRQPLRAPWGGDQLEPSSDPGQGTAVLGAISSP